jgi:hypothetical protein
MMGRMKVVDKLTLLLKEKHGRKLDLKNDVYYLFLKGGVFSLYYDEDEKTVKVNVEFLPEDNTFVYFDDTDLESLMS